MLGLFVAKLKTKNEARVLAYLERHGIEAPPPKKNVLKAGRQFAAQKPRARAAAEQDA